MIFSVNYSIDDESPEMKHYEEAYKVLYGSSAGFGSAVSYDAAQALFEALEKSPDLKPVSVKKTFIDIGSFKGIVGDFTIDGFGDAHKQISLYQVQGGAYVRTR